MSSEDRKQAGEVGRRGFFRHLVADIVSFGDEIKDNARIKPDEMGSLSDDLIPQIVPVLSESRTYQLAGDVLRSRNNDNEPFSDLRTLDDIEMFIINAFNGVLNIDDISLQVMQTFRIDFDEAYKRVRTFFIFLVQHNICTLPEIL